MSWPLTADLLAERKKDVTFFETLAAINERFAKLQDTLAAAMRHACFLAAEPNESFLKVLVFYEKMGVLESIESWQLCRTARNLAAHDYEIECGEIADHFNSLNHLTPLLYQTASHFVSFCQTTLNIDPKPGEFSADFISIVKHTG